MIDANLKQRVETWISGDVDEHSRGELQAVLNSGDSAELTDRMAGPLEFGTAGLRGIIGAGPNRMNRAVIIRTTAGLAEYLLKVGSRVAERGVVVGYDGRRMGREFAEDTAAVLCAFGIRVWLFPDYASTPQTAFATTELRAAAGVMVTASHNPPEYNGYKVYWENGAQIVPPHDVEIARTIDSVGMAKEVNRLSLSEARSRGLLKDISAELTEKYLSLMAAHSVRSEGREGFEIVYTPLHGVGYLTARDAFARYGFHDVHCVPEQERPDGEFPTVRFPNPEEEGAMDLSLALAEKIGANLILANDPDADRLAAAVPEPGGSYRLLSGNQIGILLANYLLTESPNPPRDRLVITSIVSSPMLGVMAEKLGVRYEEVLTGFKWIANQAMDLEKKTGTTFVFGYEEALGYTVGTLVRDKDGVGAAVLFAEMAAVYHSRGSSVLKELEGVYRSFGLYLSRQKSVTMKGLDGSAKIASIMNALRADPPASIGEFTVEAIRDYQKQTRRSKDGGVTTLALPPSNVLSFEITGGSRVIARPSGTEPKIKFYFDLREQVIAGESMAAAEARAQKRLDELQKAFIQLVS
ncbi:MAG: phosphomannomutase [Bdellovibrionales bacterium GWB1_55_8]|nr:MAG: phosphomannomutase [Bdellovibrionales bacterium GWB1_55_8]